MKMLASIAIAAATLAVPAAAEPVEEQFEHDGVVYEYTAETHADRTVLAGRAYPGNRFRLIVRDGRVTGYAGHQRVNFTIDEAREQFGSMTVEPTAD